MKILKVISVGLLAGFISCTSNKIDEPVPVDCSISTLDFTATTTDADCGQNNGKIVIFASGGEPPYTYAIDDPTMQTESTIDNLEAGNYIIIITDNVKCSVSKSISVASKGGFQATASLTPSGCKTTNGAITVQPVNGQSPYSYSLGIITQLSPTFTNLSAGEHEVVVIDDTGCEFSLIETILTGVSYSSTIRPLINTNCAISGCHNGSQSPDFRTYDGVKANTPRIREFTQSGFMPRNGSLTEAEKNAIACWVDDGALNN
ncbi:MAG: SprB repeat-containing protein [Cyclobacteriaceae bacterium]|nr:SprB repeat-containing protein [Cyclobacteriaceae bacterium]